MRAAIAEHRIPGSVLGVVTSSGQSAYRYAGNAQREPLRRAMTQDTWFDLASLTKVLFTAPRILSHIDNGVMALDDPLITVLPDLNQYHSNSWIRQITFGECLSHQTPLPAVEPIYTYGRDADLLRAFVLQRNWRKGSPVYSDINYILLGLALERIEGKRIRDMSPGAGFAFHADANDSAATERCTWRGTVLRGEVHDDNCHALQGAGHAGLFGTANSILANSLELLNGNAGSARVLETQRTPVSDSRTYGWERKHQGWSGGERCSEKTMGHTGFTGTGLWLDFDAGLSWTLLTNGIHPTRHAETGIDALRRTVGECLY